MPKTIVIEGRIGLTTLASLMLYYQKKRGGAAFTSRSEAISFICEVQLASMSEREDFRILTEEEALNYLNIVVGGKGLINRRRAAQAFAKENMLSELSPMSMSLSMDVPEDKLRIIEDALNSVDVNDIDKKVCLDN
jgi:hypothetical protein